MKQYLKPLIIIILVFITGYFLESLELKKDYLENFEVLAELSTVFASFSIFAVTWIAYRKSKDNNTLFIGTIFLIIGILDMFHLLSSPFIPVFITENSHQKSIIFWGESRLLSSLLFLASVYIYKDTFSRFINQFFLICFAISISLLSLILVLFYPEYLPLLEYSYGTPTKLRDFQIYFSAFILVIASFLYSKRIKETRERNLDFLIFGFIFTALSDLVYFDLEITGHFLKIIAFYYIFIALYVTSVELPYEKLAIAEEKLRNTAEEKYRNLFDNANDAIIIHDLQGMIISWNKAAEKIFGWTKQEVTGKKLLPIIVPEEFREEMQKVSCGIIQSGSSYFEPIFLRKDGSRINASLTVSNLKEAGGNVTGISCIIRDITERKRLEETLQLRGRIIETMAEGVNLIHASDGVIVYTNPKFERMFGYGQGELIGKPVSIVYAPMDKNPQQVAAEITEVLNETGQWNGETYNIKKDGTKFWCYTNVSTFEHPEYGMVWISVHTDITHSKKAQEALQRSEEQLKKYREHLEELVNERTIDLSKSKEEVRAAASYSRNLIETSLDPLVTIDKNGNIMDVNKATELITGLSREHLIGSDISIYFTEPEKAKEIFKLVFSQGFIRDYPVAIRQSSGKVTDVLYNATLYKNEAGEIQGVLAAARDVTELKRAEESLRLAKEIAENANMVKTTFLNTVSHELITPLNAIMCYTEILKTELEGTSKDIEESADNILKSSEHLMDLINDILDLSRAERGTLELVIEKIQVLEIIDDTITIIKDLASKKNILIKKELDKDLDYIEVDKKRLKQILINLLANSVKYCKDQGGIIIIKTRKNENMAEFSVSDTGIGIKEDDIKKLFIIFKQLDSKVSRKYQGAGIGLAFSKYLVELHGGKIWVESKYGQGSTFTISLPIEAKGDI